MSNVLRRATSVALLIATCAVLLGPPAAAAPATAVTRAVARLVIGYSVRHRPIVAYHLGNPKIRRVDVVIGQMHGDEHAGVRVVESMIHGGRISGINLWVIPTMNPDGNAANTRQNADGVDLNRNFPVSWQRMRGRYNSGSRPLSEPESRAVHAFLLRIRPRDVVSMHQPLFGVDTTDGGAVDPGLRTRLAHNLGLPSKPFRCHSECHGGMTRWYTRRHYGVAITVEFGAHPSKHYLTGRARRGIIAALGGRVSG